MRINKLLSNYGICSRKAARKLIEQERIIVNGKYCIQGQWVEESDDILLDNKKLIPRERVYIAFNKPRGIICTADEDIKGNIIEFIGFNEYIFPIGRLDKESQGLILLTNDGEMANNILESENRHEKEYIVKVHKPYDDNFLKQLESGVEILGVITRNCKTQFIDNTTFKIILTQGLNKQIRRMCKKFGYDVVFLKRIRIINVKIDDIDEGKWRYLSKEEINYLCNI